MFPGMPWQSQPPTPSHFPASSLQEITEVFSDTADSFPLLLYYINIRIFRICRILYKWNHPFFELASLTQPNYFEMYPCYQQSIPF